MNASTEAGTTDAAAESAPAEKQEQQAQPNSFVTSLLADAKEMGYVIGPPTRTQPEAAAPPKKTEEEATPSLPQESEEEEVHEPIPEPKEEPEPEEEESEEGETDKKHLSIEDELKEYAAKGERPPWYLSRIAAQSEKMRNRTKERDQAIELSQRLDQEVKSLQQQLQSSIPPVSDDRPELNCWNDEDFRMLESECNRAIRWAALNPNGGDFPLYKKNGEDVYKNLDTEGTVDLKLKAERTRDKGIPMKQKFLEEQKAWDAQADEIYPQLKDRNSLMSRQIDEYLRQIPVLRLVPDIRIWMGHALTRRNEYFAEQQGKARKETRERITQSVRQKVAPIIPRSRGSIIPRSGADLDKALETLKQKGDADAAERWLEAKWAKPQSKIERVQ